MKLMQNSFPQFRKIEVELTKEQEIEKIPEGPSKYQCFSTLDITIIIYLHSSTRSFTIYRWSSASTRW